MLASRRLDRIHRHCFSAGWLTMNGKHMIGAEPKRISAGDGSFMLRIIVQHALIPAFILIHVLNADPHPLGIIILKGRVFCREAKKQFHQVSRGEIFFERIQRVALVVRLDSWLLLSGSSHELNVRHKDGPSSFPKAGLCLHVLLSIHRAGRPDIRWRDLSRKYDGGR